MNHPVLHFLFLSLFTAVPLPGAESLPLGTQYWKDESFRKSFNGSYRIEARIEPAVSSEVRGLLVEVQELMKTGRREAALRKVRESKLTSGSAALQFNLGNLQFEEGKLEEAARAYRNAIEEFPSFRRAHRNLAMVLVREDKLDEALEPLLEAVRLGDSDGATYGLLGYCRLQRNEWASALQAYRMAQLSQPDTAEWKAGVAQCLQHLESREEAVALLDEVIRQRPGVASYANLQASMLIELGRSEEAVKALELPRRLETLEPDGLLLLADLHLRAARVDDAALVIDEAFAGDDPPSLERVMATTGSAMALGSWDLARQLVDRATPEEGESPRQLRRVAARLRIESGEAPEEGAAELEALLGEDPTDGASLLALGRYHAGREALDEALLLFERATAVDEVEADAWVELARVEVKRGFYREALEAVDEALALRPGGSLGDYRESLRALAEAAE